MQRTIIFHLIFLFEMRSFGKGSSSQNSTTSEIESRNGCVLIYDLKSEKLLHKIGSTCSKRVTPCSTFKIPIALMAFEEGLLKDATSSLKWDHKTRNNPAWNHDQTARSWLENSVVWFSQKLTVEMGMTKVKSYLAKFNYGNQDMSGGVTQAWLDGSLKISAEEQLEFFHSLLNGKILVAKSSLDKTLEILPEEKLSNGVLKGKTGSSGTYKEDKPLLSHTGLYVGYFRSSEKTYIVSANYNSTQQPGDPVRPGLVAQNLVKKVLLENFTK